MEALVKREIIESFNDKPKNGINKIREWSINNSKDFVEEVAKFFYEEKNNLNLEFVGDYLGTDGEDNKKILKNFTNQLNFKEKDYLESLQEFLGACKLPSEAQKIDRLVESFCSKYHEQNLNDEIKSKDAAYILAFQIMMLNTDLHKINTSKSSKMTFEQLKNNLRGTNENQNFNDDLLRKIYDGIKESPLKLNFIENASGYEIKGISTQNDETFKKLNNLLEGKADIKDIFPKVQNNNDFKVELTKPKSWLSKFTGYEGSAIIKDGNAEVEIQVYKPSMLSKWFLGEKNKLVIQPKQQSEQSLKLAAQIAASFETKVTSIKATYDYLKKDLKNQYENAIKPELVQATSATKLQESIKEITKDLQKHDPQIPDIHQKPLASRQNFEDLVQAEIGMNPAKSQSVEKPKFNSIAEELAWKNAQKKQSVSTPSISQNEEPRQIDNHKKRLEELKQKQQELETKRKELEEKKANTNIREERWKITTELEGISNQLKGIEKEHNNINSAVEREKQFNNKTKQPFLTVKESTAADLQQRNAMAAIKHMKEQKQQKEADSKLASSNTPTMQPLKPGIIPPPPPMPGNNYPIPTPPPIPNLNSQKTNVMPKIQKEAKTIAKQISGEKNEHIKELGDAMKKQRKILEQNSSSRER